MAMHNINQNLNISNMNMHQAINELLDWWALSGIDTPILSPANSTKPKPNAPIAKDLPVFTKPKDNQTIATDLALKANTIDELKALIESFDEVSIKKSSNNIVFNDGNIDSPIMIIGDAPSSEDDFESKPFMGISGTLLDNMLAAVGINRQNAYYTYCVNFRAPGGRKPFASEIAIFRPLILKHIELKKPKLIIIIGDLAVKSLFNTEDGINKFRGKQADLSILETNYPCLTLFHPDYLIKQPLEKAKTWQDLQILKKLVQNINA